MIHILVLTNFSEACLNKLSDEVEKLFDEKKRKQVLNRLEHSQEPSEIRTQIVDALMIKSTN